jgi:peptide/nickel transport system substrate-binding protein
MRFLTKRLCTVAMTFGVVMLGNPALAGGTLKVRSAIEPETLFNGITISGTPNDILGSFLLERLVSLDTNGDLKPWLAKTFSFSDGGKVITFKLRDGITFHDGTPFNAAAVKAQFDFVLDPANASPTRSFLGPLKKVETPDDETVEFTFSEPYAPFMNNIAQASFGINSPTALKKEGPSQYGRHPVGTGPFQFDSWVPGSQIRLVRYPSYQQFRTDVTNKGPAIADDVVISIIPEATVAAAALETGELNAVVLPPDEVKVFENDPAYNVISIKNDDNLIFLEFNQRRAPFDDPKAREALSYAIDRDSIVTAAFGSYAQPAYSPLSPGISDYDPAVGKDYGSKFDLERARELLRADGWTMGSNGVLQKNGKEARLVIKSYAGFPYVDRSIAIIQQDLKKLGIELNVVTSEWGSYYPSLKNNDWDLNFLRWNWNDPGVLNNLFRSPGHRGAELPIPAVDDTLDRCNRTVEPTARKACVSDAQKELLQHNVVVPIAENFVMIAMRGKIKDYHLDFMGYLLSSDVDPGQ